MWHRFKTLRSQGNEISQPAYEAINEIKLVSRNRSQLTCEQVSGRHRKDAGSGTRGCLPRLVLSRNGHAVVNVRRTLKPDVAHELVAEEGTIRLFGSHEWGLIVLSEILHLKSLSLASV